MFGNRDAAENRPLCNEDVGLVLQRTICFPSSFASGLFLLGVCTLYMCNGKQLLANPYKYNYSYLFHHNKPVLLK